MTQDSDSMPLDGAPDLNEQERLALRRLIRDEERAAWARRKLKVVMPAIVAFVIGTWQLIDWAKTHISWK